MAASAVNFVKTIEQFPCLYDNRLSEYSRRDSTDIAWSEVAEKVNLSVPECQSKWKCIRSGFVRSLKLPNQKRLYYLHNELQFIVPFLKNGNPRNISEDTSINEESQFVVPFVKTEIRNGSEMNDDTESNSSNEEPIHTPETIYTEPITNSVKKPKMRKVSNEAEVFVDWIKKQENKNDNPRRMFLLSLLPDVENLTVDQMQKFRIKVLLLLDRIQSGSSQAENDTDN